MCYLQIIIYLFTYLFIYLFTGRTPKRADSQASLKNGNIHPTRWNWLGITEFYIIHTTSQMATYRTPIAFSSVSPNNSGLCPALSCVPIRFKLVKVPTDPRIEVNTIFTGDQKSRTQKNDRKMMSRLSVFNPPASKSSSLKFWYSRVRKITRYALWK